MYGLANKILQDMIVARYGSDQWNNIREKSGVQESAFLSMSCYPDETTYRIVGAANAVLGIPPENVLFQFGEYWIMVAEQDYADMLAFAGSNLVDIFNSVDDIHERATLIFPEMKPPSFRCTDIADDSFRLHYRSIREGLAPFVEGLIAGLGQRLSTPVDIVHDKHRASGEDHDEFIVAHERA